MNSIQLLIKEICEEENIKFSLISNDWIIVMEKDDKIHYLIGMKFDLNNYVSAKICNDKYACYSALKYNNIPVCEYHILYKDTSRDEVLNTFNEYNSDIVLKANKGCYGDSVFHIKNEDELFSKMELLFKKNYSISMCPFYDIKCEYRIIVLNNNVELIYGKMRAIIVGDGVHTTYELLCEFNKPFFEKIDHSDLDFVLEKGKEYVYSFKHNISKGAKPFKIDDKDLYNRLSDLAITATKKLNLKFVSVDIVELYNNELKIIEINSGVITNICDYFPDGEEIAKRIYKRAVLAMFEK